jgi:hypothetical protein
LVVVSASPLCDFEKTEKHAPPKKQYRFSSKRQKGLTTRHFYI